MIKREVCFSVSVFAYALATERKGYHRNDSLGVVNAMAGSH